SDALHGRHRFDDEPYYFELRTGWSTTVGLIGLVAEYNLSDRVAVGAGAGLNLYGDEWELNARFRPLIAASRNGLTLHALTIESALSTSKYSGSPFELVGCLDGCDRTLVPQQVLWAQLDLGWEMRLGSGMTVRAALGGAALLGKYEWLCGGSGTGSC